VSNKRAMATMGSVLWLCLSVDAWARPPEARGQVPATIPPAQRCSVAAKKALGSDAEVLKCGQLTGMDALETVAAVRLKKYRANADGIPVSTLLILREASPEWRTELAITKQSMRNDAGLIEDCSSFAETFVGYRVSLDDADPADTETPGFSVGLYFLDASGQNEGISTEIIWNPSVSRFQKFDYDDLNDPHQFLPEIHPKPVTPN
jgi:hypothetical protein